MADPDGDLTDPPATLTLLQEQLFTNNCAVCHKGPSSPLAPGISMDLQDSQTRGTTVGVNAQELTVGVRIQPNSAANSYLYQKVNTCVDTPGDPCEVPSVVLDTLSCSGVPVADCGDRMPPLGGGLSPDDLADLRAWINAGALDD